VVGHPHVSFGDLHPQGLGERPDGVVARVVDPTAQPDQAARDAAGQYEVGDPTRLLLRRGEQVRQGRVRGVHRAERVQLDHPPPVRGVGALDRPEQHHPGVGQHRVQPPELLDRPLDRGTGLGLVGDVRGDG
jgi:hypothetical protein